ncbi:MAG: helix-turn-helix domain-containing protein [Pseudomonadota bacterium]
MARPGLTGSRIREQRLRLGVKQAELAASVGVSASYLNLIEHNRRRIAGKLVLDIARSLQVEPQLLIEGAEAALLDTLREAAGRMQDAQAEVARVEDFAGRLPGWAGLVAAQHRRIRFLERTVETLTDRLAHDPHLAASLHDMISTITSIRSTAAILTDTDNIEPEWQARFQRNIGEDSERLSETGQSLVAYLDDVADAEQAMSSPQDELEAFLKARSYHFAELENASETPDDLVAAAQELTSQSGRSLARSFLSRYAADAAALPLGPFHEAALDMGFRPDTLSQRFGVDLARVFRRLATLPNRAGKAPVGLVVCDGSGSLTFRKPTEGFSVPRFGAGCPLWPLYQALSRPMVPVQARLRQAGPAGRPVTAYAIAQPLYPGGFSGPVVFEASMLVLSDGQDRTEEDGPLQVGSSCRVCPAQSCDARREPSILSSGL